MLYYAQQFVKFVKFVKFVVKNNYLYKLNMNSYLIREIRSRKITMSFACNQKVVCL